MAANLALPFRKSMDCSHEKRVSNKSNCRRIFGWFDKSQVGKYLTTGKFPDFNE
jgi:hypothetical protein